MKSESSHRLSLKRASEVSSLRKQEKDKLPIKIREKIEAIQMYLVFEKLEFQEIIKILKIVYYPINILHNS